MATINGKEVLPRKAIQVLYHKRDSCPLFKNQNNAAVPCHEQWRGMIHSERLADVIIREIENFALELAEKRINAGEEGVTGADILFSTYKKNNREKIEEVIRSFPGEEAQNTQDMQDTQNVTNIQRQMAEALLNTLKKIFPHYYRKEGFPYPDSDALFAEMERHVMTIGAHVQNMLKDPNKKTEIMDDIRRIQISDSPCETCKKVFS